MHRSQDDPRHPTFLNDSPAVLKSPNRMLSIKRGNSRVPLFLWPARVRGNGALESMMGVPGQEARSRWGTRLVTAAMRPTLEFYGIAHVCLDRSNPPPENVFPQFSSVGGHIYVFLREFVAADRRGGLTLSEMTPTPDAAHSKTFILIRCDRPVDGTNYSACRLDGDKKSPGPSHCRRETLFQQRRLSG